ncbi:hypothetical protein MYX84_02575 [Acidobacteria bacterium AH-259-O06]|nr:hypothetical protein [Acidobacteria bacterium AH-259-O06]
MKTIRFTIALFALALTGQAQTSNLKISTPEFEIPEYIMERLSAADKLLFEKLSRVSLESVWAQMRAEGFDQNFISQLTPLHTNRRMIGRARTIRYLPNRPDLRQVIYSKQKQLNYVSAEETEPGDVLVFDAGGETRAAVSGDVTTTRFLYRGGTGLVIDGAMRDVPELEGMHIQVYMRRGQAAAVSPIMMSVDYQVPVRIGSVTVLPGDILLGDRHGILVIPASIVDKVVDKALKKDELENFQRKLLLEGESIYDVYPANDKVKKRFEEYQESRAEK